MYVQFTLTLQFVMITYVNVLSLTLIITCVLTLNRKIIFLLVKSKNLIEDVTNCIRMIFLMNVNESAYS